MGANGRRGKELEKVVIEKSQGRGPVLLANDHECEGK